jgi:hypothetical protein
MKVRIAAAMLVACTAGSACTIDIAAAAKVISVPRVHHAAMRHVGVARDTVRPYREPYYAGGSYYYARPFFYIPAPFPLGFDFGFGR